MLHTMIEEDDDTPPPEELEMFVEEALGHDTPGTLEDRIEALKKRVAYLEGHLREAVNDEIIASFKKDLDAARQQLARLQAVHESRN